MGNSGTTMRMGGISFTVPSGHELDPAKVTKMWVEFFDRHSGTVLPLGSAVNFIPDPRIARDRQRAEIDAILREDARRFPAFATARKAAVMAACEMWGDEPQVLGSVRAMLINGGWLHSYEARRGGRTKPSEDADRYARATFGTEVQGHYERARSMR